MSKPSLNFLISSILLFILTVPSFGQTRVGKFGIGVDGSMQYLLGAGTTNPSPRIGYGINSSYSVMEYLGIRSKFAINQLDWKGGTGKAKITDLMTLNLYLSADLMPNNTFNPFIFVGGGMVFFDPKNDLGNRASSASSFDMNYIGGIGADYFLNEFWSITLMGEYVLTNSAYYAGSTAPNPNTNNDSFMRVSLQVRYYFFDQAFITKLLEAQRERSKGSK